MPLWVNEKEIDFHNQNTGELRDIFKPDADIIIVDGHIVSEDYIVEDRAKVYLIKRGEMPSDEELQFLLTARHSPKVHDILKTAKVGVAGLGGLGSNAAAALARMGVGSMVLVDFDVVTPANINRQNYFLDQIGMKKTDAATENLKRINPYINYTAKDTYITKENVFDIFCGCDVIIEALDKAENKAMLINTCASKLKDTMIIGASGIAGLYDTESLKIKKIGKNIILIGDFVNEARVGQGLMATRVGVAANMQAHIAVKYLLGDL